MEWVDYRDNAWTLADSDGRRLPVHLEKRLTGDNYQFEYRVLNSLETVVIQANDINDAKVKALTRFYRDVNDKLQTLLNLSQDLEECMNSSS